MILQEALNLRGDDVPRPPRDLSGAGFFFLKPAGDGNQTRVARLSTVSSGRSPMGQWPQFFSAATRAPGIARAKASVWRKGVIWSLAPSSRSVGQRTFSAARPPSP